jgi:hypothetical protein
VPQRALTDAGGRSGANLYAPRPGSGRHGICTSLPRTWPDADGGWAIPPKGERRLTAPQASCPNPAMRLNVSLPSSLRGPRWRPWLSSQYERFSFGDPLLVQAWLAMSHGSWPIPARRQDGVASHGKHLAVSHTTFKTEEGTPSGSGWRVCIRGTASMACRTFRSSRLAAEGQLRAL